MDATGISALDADLPTREAKTQLYALAPCNLPRTAMGDNITLYALTEQSRSNGTSFVRLFAVSQHKCLRELTGLMHKAGGFPVALRDNRFWLRSKESGPSAAYTYAEQLAKLNGYPADKLGNAYNVHLL